MVIEKKKKFLSVVSPDDAAYFNTYTYYLLDIIIIRVYYQWTGSTARRLNGQRTN